MKLLHISDLHFPTTVPIFSLRWKMFSGYFNYKLRRQKKYPKEILNALIDHPLALAFDPMLVKRLQRMRAARQRARSARRLGIELKN